MTDENQKKPHTYPTIVDRNEAWGILNNQITVQEQLRTRGQQILTILSALAAVAIGVSFSLDSGISDAAVENTVATTPLSESMLRDFLSGHIIVSFFLLILVFMYFFSFVARNYAASRHSSLQPGLGERYEAPIRVAATTDYRNLLTGDQVLIQRYEEWIESNSRKLESKRHHLGIANMSLVLLFDCLVLRFLLLNTSSNAAVGGTIYIDLFLVMQVVFILFIYLATRDRLRSVNPWSLSQNHKEHFYFLDTMEFTGTVLFSIFILLTLLVSFWPLLPLLPI